MPLKETLAKITNVTKNVPGFGWTKWVNEKIEEGLTEDEIVAAAADVEANFEEQQGKITEKEEAHVLTGELIEEMYQEYPELAQSELLNDFKKVIDAADKKNFDLAGDLSKFIQDEALFTGDAQINEITKGIETMNEALNIGGTELLAAPFTSSSLSPNKPPNSC